MELVFHGDGVDDGEDGAAFVVVECCEVGELVAEDVVGGVEWSAV